VIDAKRRKTAAGKLIHRCHRRQNAVSDAMCSSGRRQEPIHPSSQLTVMQMLIQRWAVLACMLFSVTGCFPTFQAARIDPGFRLEASAVVLGDQARRQTPQGTDIIGMLTPAYGFGRRVEIGVPVGVYAEEGLFNSGPLNGDKNSILVMPYLKVAFLESGSPHHLALIAQSALALPANVGVRYGRDLGSWEPHVGANYIFSGGTAGDDPTITRYQERNQTMVAISAGATFKRWNNTAVEIGVLRNSYEEEGGFNGSSTTYQRVRYYDAYAGLRVNLFRQRR
jgi:hypothetical protein